MLHERARWLMARGVSRQVKRAAAFACFFALMSGPAMAQMRTQWVSASDLKPELPVVADLANQGDFYYGNVGSLTGYFAARIDLPEGALLQSTICYFRDGDILFDGSAHILRVFEFDPPANPAPNWQPILSLGTTGASGYQRLVGNVTIPIAHHGTDSLGNSFNQFYVLYVIAPPLSVLPGLPILSSATFRGCELRYTPPAS